MTNQEMHKGVEALYVVSGSALTLARLESPLGIWNTLGILMDLENVLDKGRAYGRPSNPAEDIMYKQVVANMDTLRGIIRELLDAQDKNEVREFMKDRGISAARQFSVDS